MEVYLNRIDGIDDAMVSLTMTNKVWNRDIEEHIRDIVRCVNDSKGRFVPQEEGYDDIEGNEYSERFTKLLNDAKKHITVGSFIDFSCTIGGLHRAGQD